MSSSRSLVSVPEESSPTASPRDEPVANDLSLPLFQRRRIFSGDKEEISLPSGLKQRTSEELTRQEQEDLLSPLASESSKSLLRRQKSPMSPMSPTGSTFSRQRSWGRQTSFDVKRVKGSILPQIQIHFEREISPEAGPIPNILGGLPGQLSSGQLGQSSGQLGQSSASGHVEMAMNQTLKLFVLHFFVLYVTQVCVQFLAVSFDYADRNEYLDLGIHSKDFLTAADIFCVFLFCVEVGVQMSVSGVDMWLKTCMHKFDLAVLTVSLVFCIVDVTIVSITPCLGEGEAPEVNNSWQKDFELLRDGLRMIRLVAFLEQLVGLLNRPLDHFAMLAEDIENAAEEINEYI